MPGRLAVGQVRPFHHGRFYPRAWTTFGPTGWGTVGPSTVVFVPGPSPDRPLRPVLPTTADLPVVNIVRETADPPLLYVVNDLTRGRSTRPGGARIVYAGPARPLGRAPVGMRSEGGPHIIELTAR